MALIATFNVNSVRARLDNICAFLDERQPDVVLCQEIKAQEEQFPYKAFEERGYHAKIKGQKSYHGVAVLAREPVKVILDELPQLEGEAQDFADDVQARYIEVEWRGARLASIYLPNGNPLFDVQDGDALESEKYRYKLDWMKRLHARFQTLLALEVPVIMGGDYNVIPRAIDCYDPKAWQHDALYYPPTRAAYQRLLNLGYYDAFRVYNNQGHAYTFWDYQGGAYQKDQGIRIDHFLLSPLACDRMRSCWIDVKPRRLEKASDHTPLMLEIDL